MLNAQRKLNEGGYFFLLGSLNQSDKISVKVVQHTVIVHELFQKGVNGCILGFARLWLQSFRLSRSPHDDADRKGFLHNILIR